jgi:hypothetical protein
MVSKEEARDDTRTAGQPTALEELTRLHGERIVTYRQLLNPGEVVHGTADSFFLQLALQHGPAAGEGILFVTSAGLVWASEQWPGGYRWPKTDIRRSDVRRCPRSWHGHRLHRRRQRRQMRLLHLEVESTEMDKMDLMAARPVITDAVRYLNGEPPELSLRLWRVEWAEAGATFVVAQQTGGDEPVIKATLDAELDYEPGDPELAAAYMLLDQAWGELRASLGLASPFHYEWPRPEWMPEFAWTPPLAVNETHDEA